MRQQIKEMLREQKMKESLKRFVRNSGKVLSKHEGRTNYKFVLSKMPYWKCVYSSARRPPSWFCPKSTDEQYSGHGT